MFVVEVNGVIAGFGEYFGDEVRAIYVRPVFSRRGVGRELFRKVIEKLSENGVQMTRWDASLTSVPFYQAMGAKVVEHREHTLSGGIKVTCAHMEMNLSSK